MLGKAADFYEAEVDDMVAGLSSLMEPIIIVFLGVHHRRHRGVDVPAHLQARPGRLMLVSQGIDAALAGVLGLLDRQLPQRRDLPPAEDAGARSGRPSARSSTGSGARGSRAEFNLVLPRSRCRQCGHVDPLVRERAGAQLPVPARQVLGLQARRSACATRWSNWSTGALFALCVWRCGVTLGGCAWCGFRGAADLPLA